MLRNLSGADVKGALSIGPFVYVGAVSFEQRATAWANHLAGLDVRPERAVIFDYDTEAEPLADDKALRKQSESGFRTALGKSDLSFLRGVNAFAINVLESAMIREVTESPATTVLIDITCLTRVHLFAAAAAANRARRDGKTIIYCYAAAHGYGFSKNDLQGWRDVLFVSVSKGASMDSNARSYGIISAGHDGERLSVALQELEPPSGVMVYASNPDRPDFTSRALRANEVTHTRLEALRSPRQNHGVKIDDRWSFEHVQVADFDGLSKCVSQQAGFAESASGTVAIYPFGPKPMTLCIAETLKVAEKVPAWMVYPIPERFSVTYSTGTGSLSAYLST